MKAQRAAPTSEEHDRYTWALNEYLIRQGHGSYVVFVPEGSSAAATSSTGRLAPEYDARGVIKVIRWQMLLAYLLHMATGSPETPKGGHPSDPPFPTGRAWRWCTTWHVRLRVPLSPGRPAIGASQKSAGVFAATPAP